jgi:vacuolar-type H+-ATPase subunit I/STV1
MIDGKRKCGCMNYINRFKKEYKVSENDSSTETLDNFQKFLLNNKLTITKKNSLSGLLYYLYVIVFIIGVLWLIFGLLPFTTDVLTDIKIVNMFGSNWILLISLLGIGLIIAKRTIGLLSVLIMIFILTYLLITDKSFYGNLSLYATEIKTSTYVSSQIVKDNVLNFITNDKYAKQFITNREDTLNCDKLDESNSSIKCDLQTIRVTPPASENNDLE